MYFGKYYTYLFLFNNKIMRNSSYQNFTFCSKYYILGSTQSFYFLLKFWILKALYQFLLFLFPNLCLKIKYLNEKLFAIAEILICETIHCFFFGTPFLVLNFHTYANFFHCFDYKKCFLHAQNFSYFAPFLIFQ